MSLWVLESRDTRGPKPLNLFRPLPIFCLSNQTGVRPRDSSTSDTEEQETPGLTSATSLGS